MRWSLHPGSELSVKSVPDSFSLSLCSPPPLKHTLMLSLKKNKTKQTNKLQVGGTVFHRRAFWTGREGSRGSQCSGQALKNESN